jgi:tetratricopeptide (TPR) repeat protein
MSTPDHADQRSQQPDLGQLFTAFLKRQATTGPDEGTDTPGEVVLLQAATLLPVEPRTALQEALEPAEYLLDADEAKALRPQALKGLPDWPALVRGQDSTVAVAMCLGNFPQMLKSITPLFAGAPLETLRPEPGRPLPVGELAAWGAKMLASGKVASALFAAGALRLAGQFDEAAALIARVRQEAGAKWQAVLLNEEAALAWHRGEHERAAQLWARHPEQDNPVVLFNRGLTALFAGRADEAQPLLGRAADSLPETSAWHHLARLYLSLAQAS